MVGNIGRRGLAFPRRLLQATPRASTCTGIRSFSNAPGGGSSEGFYVSKRAVKTTLLLGAGLAAGYLYSLNREKRENADRQQIKLALQRSQLSLEKGDFEQAMKEEEEAYELVKAKFPTDKEVIAMAMAIGTSYEKADQFAAAIPFYLEALEHLYIEPRVVYHEDLRVVLMDRLGQCHKHMEDPEAAEKYFKQAIDVYDKLKGKLSLSPEPVNESSLTKVDEDILNVLLHYIVLLTVQKRPEEAACARDRLRTIARGCSHLRGQVKRIEDQVDDYVALEKIREERKLQELKEDDGSDIV